MNEFSVGDFAEQLMAEDEIKAKGPSPVALESPSQSFYSANAIDQVDISHVEIPNDFVKSIVENKDVIPVPTVETPVQGEPSSIQEEIRPSQLTPLLEDIKILLSQIKDTIAEVTAVGALGAGATKRSKKREDSAPFSKGAPFSEPAEFSPEEDTDDKKKVNSSKKQRQKVEALVKSVLQKRAGTSK